MLASVLHAFVGAFAALLVIAEIQSSNKLLKYFFALVVGIVVAVVLGMTTDWILRIVGKAG